jgi:hypothetical protein
MGLDLTGVVVSPIEITIALMLDQNLSFVTSCSLAHYNLMKPAHLTPQPWVFSDVGVNFDLGLMPEALPARDRVLVRQLQHTSELTSASQAPIVASSHYRSGTVQKQGLISLHVVTNIRWRLRPSHGLGRSGT